MTSAESAAGAGRRWTDRLRERREERQARRQMAARLQRQHLRIAALERDMTRLGPQLAALEARIEDLHERLTTPAFETSEQAEALSLVEEIRREHQRIRARVTAASRFEERLRQLEERVGSLTPDQG